MKSEKAEKYLSENGLGYPYTGYVTEQTAERAAELAEQEAEERMRERAIEAFDDMWISGGEPDYECLRKKFIRKLK